MVVAIVPGSPTGVLPGEVLTGRQVEPCPVGYSDHTEGVGTGAAAVACGAAILEKHLTYDRTAPGPDHRASLEPGSLGDYCAMTRSGAGERDERMVGGTTKRVLDCEQDVRHVSRQSLTTTRDLETGHVLTRQDLTIKRPGTGIAPYKLSEIVGRTLARDIEADVPLVDGDLA